MTGITQVAEITYNYLLYASFPINEIGLFAWAAAAVGNRMKSRMASVGFLTASPGDSWSIGAAFYQKQGWNTRFP